MSKISDEKFLEEITNLYSIVKDTTSGNKDINQDEILDKYLQLIRLPYCFKLYMPLKVRIYDEFEDYDSSIVVSGREDIVKAYAEAIKNAIDKYDFRESIYGLIEYYNEKDTIKEKVKDGWFDVEEKYGQLFGVFKSHCTELPNQDEINSLKIYVSGQASDGWGEGFEQRGIHVKGIEDPSEIKILYVSFWSYKNNWSIMTEDELKEKYG